MGSLSAERDDRVKGCATLLNRVAATYNLASITKHSFAAFAVCEILF
jgi:hypothetical protein